MSSVTHIKYQRKKHEMQNPSGFPIPEVAEHAFKGMCCHSHIKGTDCLSGDIKLIPTRLNFPMDRLRVFLCISICVYQLPGCEFVYVFPVTKSQLRSCCQNEEQRTIFMSYMH